MEHTNFLNFLNLKDMLLRVYKVSNKDYKLVILTILPIKLVGSNIFLCVCRRSVIREETRREQRTDKRTRETEKQKERERETDEADTK